MEICLMLKKIDYRRILAWVAVAIIAIWTANICGINITTKTEEEKRKKENYKIDKELTLFWEFQKERVNQINKLASDYIEYYKLNPGNSLPPNTFYDEKDKTLKKLTKTTPIQIIIKKKIEIPLEKSNNLLHPQMGEETSEIWGKKTITAIALITIANTVPNTKENYAYIGMLYPYSIDNKGYKLYPEDDYSLENIKEANEEVERKYKNINNNNNNNTPIVNTLPNNQ